MASVNKSQARVKLATAPTDSSSSGPKAERSYRRPDAHALNVDDANCLERFSSYGNLAQSTHSPTDYWRIDMRLTLLWCLAYEARVRRRKPALQLLLAIIEGKRGRVNWGMWEDGDELWFRRTIIQRRMTTRFKVAAAVLEPADWEEIRAALERSVATPKRGPLAGNLETWTAINRILRIAWLTVTDGFPTGGCYEYLVKLRVIEAWGYFAEPLFPDRDDDREMRLRLRIHDLPDCIFASCRPSVWDWFKTACHDYESDKVLVDMVGCCWSCASRATSAAKRLSLEEPTCSERPKIWPVILWVAFQAQQHAESGFKDVNDFMEILESDSNKHAGLWAWDSLDDAMLERGLNGDSNPSQPGLSWIDAYPSSWREHLLLLGDKHWRQIEVATHQVNRPRLLNPEYDTAIRISAVALWVSSQSPAGSPWASCMSSLGRFLTQPLHGSLVRFLLERGVPMRASQEFQARRNVNWEHPRIWLHMERAQLQADILRNSDSRPLLDVVESVYVTHCTHPVLPQDWKQRVSPDYPQVVMLTLKQSVERVSGVDRHLENLGRHKKPDDSIDTDLRCVCAQIVDILGSHEAYKALFKVNKTDAQRLLDLLQDLLDYPPLADAAVRHLILKGLLRLSTKSGLHPRCFVLSDIQTMGHQMAAGGFGDVYKGEVLGEIVSVKVMRVYQEADVQALLNVGQAQLCQAEFYREAVIWRHLSHPNLLPFFGVYYLEATKSRLCLLSPWMENGNVVRYIQYNPFVDRLALVMDIAMGLEYLQAQKVVHGDLKGINVLVASSGRALLADFGLSSVADSKMLLQSTSSVKNGGSVRWQAPELFSVPGSRNSRASDVYAFSCVCYEIFTDTVPFYDLKYDTAVMLQVLQGKRAERPINCIKDGIWNLMEICWAQEPDKRPSAAGIVQILRERPIEALPTCSVVSDWDPSYISKFRSSLEEHTLSRSGVHRIEIESSMS
ncbi:hypothetical protein FB45DRAFT_859919 [Roridomyces roridus]|uniref:Protein kinase domain-containing protein n=1 Tax=Roridomyces roridus TaxID=1738132 RepID=A0AAD7CL24_9AGAR|nr:hypothetical protein FB45DRAFT_859919 [Roridomyces roridus]